MEVHAFLVQKRRTSLANTNTFTTKKAMHASRGARQNSTTRFHRSLDFSSRLEQGVQMAGLLRQSITTSQFCTATEPRSARSSHHRRWPSRGHKQSLEGIVRRQNRKHKASCCECSRSHAVACAKLNDSLMLLSSTSMFLMMLWCCFSVHRCFFHS